MHPWRRTQPAGSQWPSASSGPVGVVRWGPLANAARLMSLNGTVVAAIDVGTNAVRLELARRLPDGSRETLHQERDPVRPGEGVFKTGGMSKVVADRLMATLAPLRVAVPSPRRRGARGRDQRAARSAQPRQDHRAREGRDGLAARGDLGHRRGAPDLPRRAGGAFAAHRRRSASTSAAARPSSRWPWASGRPSSGASRSARSG